MIRRLCYVLVWLAWVTVLCLGSGCGDSGGEQPDAAIWRGYPIQPAPPAPAAECPLPMAPGEFNVIPCVADQRIAVCIAYSGAPDGKQQWETACTAFGRLCVDRCPPVDGGAP